MENLRKAVAEFLKEYSLYVLDKYLITYPSHFKVETYSCKDYYGIIFITEDCRYDVCHNYLMGDRLIRNPTAGGFSDIPFKPATFGFLPDGIEVKEIIG
jgi:hypothetical protein